MAIITCDNLVEELVPALNALFAGHRLWAVHVERNIADFSYEIKWVRPWRSGKPITANTYKVAALDELGAYMEVLKLLEDR